MAVTPSNEQLTKCLHLKEEACIALRRELAVTRNLQGAAERLAITRGERVIVAEEESQKLLGVVLDLEAQNEVLKQRLADLEAGQFNSNLKLTADGLPWACM